MSVQIFVSVHVFFNQVTLELKIQHLNQFNFYLDIKTEVKPISLHKQHMDNIISTTTKIIIYVLQERSRYLWEKVKKERYLSKWINGYRQKAELTHEEGINSSSALSISNPILLLTHHISFCGTHLSLLWRILQPYPYTNLETTQHKCVGF